MRLRLATLPALIASLAIAAPGIALGQTDPSPAPNELDASALTSLCAANAEDDAARVTCVEVVRTILAPAGEIAVEEPDSTDRLAVAIDEAVASAEGLDVQAAIDEVASALQELDVQSAIEEAIASAEVDVQAALDDVRASIEELEVQALVDEAVASAREVDVTALIDEAIASAQGVDVQALVDDLINEIGDQDVLGTIEGGIAETRNVVEAAQDWIEDNPELACDTGSVSVGVGAAAVVGFLTDSPGLALAAYRETQQATDRACGAAIG